MKGGGGADTLEGGDGSDTIAYGDLNIGVYVSLYSGAAFNGTASGDQFDSIENLTGSYHGDMLEGDEYVNTIKGLSGDDVLQGYGDADTIDGGDGIDTVIYGGSVLGVSVSLFNGVAHGGDAEGERERFSASCSFCRGSRMSDPISRLEVCQREIDRCFGDGHAAAHPELVAAACRARPVTGPQPVLPSPSRAWLRRSWSRKRRSSTSCWRESCCTHVRD